MTNPIDYLLLADKSKEELLKIILVQSQQISELQKQVKELQEKNNKDDESSNKPVFPKSKKKKRRKRPGRKGGHTGVTRKIPEVIDREEESTLTECPDCGSKDITQLASETSEHIQEDIIPAEVEAVKFIRHGYWCPCCKDKKMAPYLPEEVPYGYLGPNVLIQTVMMKYRYGLSYEKIVEYFQSFCSLKVTESGLAQALQRIAKWLEVEEQVIREAIKESPYLHIDETGWKIMGTNHWLWNFVNERLALYRIRRSRGRKVPKEILGDEYEGIVLSDFLSAYDKSGKKRQRCLVHLERDMDKYRDNGDDGESKQIYKKLKRILNDARRLDKRRNEMEGWVYLRRARKIKDRLLTFACGAYRNENWARISKRLLKYYKEIFTFLEVPGLPQDNNHVERMLRPFVTIRKNCYQNMSENGARTTELLMSVLQTLRLRKENPIEFFKESYLKHRKGDEIPLLTA